MHKQIHILALVPYRVFPAVMGGQKGIALFYKYLARHTRLRVLGTRNNDRAGEVYTVDAILSNARSRYLDPAVYFTLKKIAKQHEADNILFEHPYYAWMIVLFKMTGRYRIIVHSHNIESERFRSTGKWWWKLLWYYERMAYRHADVLWFKTFEDRRYAIDQYGIDASRCTVIPYGVEASQLPLQEELDQSRKKVLDLHQLPTDPELKLILFNGTLHYKPNLDALRAILDEINPLLLASSLSYRIMVCGKGLPAEFGELESYRKQNIVYCGFVDDIDLYFKACDIFLNPVMDGGGIKTKLVEALGFGKYAVSSRNGAIGVDESSCGGRLRIVGDSDWEAYAEAIINANTRSVAAFDRFYETFSWEKIALKALGSLK